MTTTSSQDPAAIEQEIRRTQDNMSSTVDKIGDQLSIKNLFNAALDKADESNIDARMLLDGARRNPIALGLIAAGAIWLISDKDSKIPSLRGKSRNTVGDDSDYDDSYHRDYVSHMSTVEQGPQEGTMEYQRRRDLARSEFFKMERGQQEDESSFRKRLDAMTEKFTEKRRAWADSSSQAGSAAREKARDAGRKAQDLYTGNPLIGGLLASAVGAAFGSALPVTQQERSKLGSLGEKARNAVGKHTEQATTQMREKKDELLERADRAIKPAPQFAGQ